MKSNSFTIKKILGFTLIEMLLVLVIASSLIVMFLNFTTQQYRQQQENKAALQMQQILNAALAYYNQNGRWPTTAGTNGQSTDWVILDSTHELIADGYLPNGRGAEGSATAWANGYEFSFKTYFPTNAISGTTKFTNTFYVGTYTTSSANARKIAAANIIAGQQPGSFVVGASSLPVPPVTSTCTDACAAVASIPPPGQNLNNARSINFGNLYKSGQCVPAPSCPAGMTPQIFVVPVQVSGSYDNAGTTTPLPVYPISSYTAYATALPDINPPNCSQGSNANCSSLNVTGGVNNQYWRVCLSITTERGVITPSTFVDTQNMGTITAITRCAPSAEPTGSPSFNVYN